MIYSINIINQEQCHLIQQDSEGKEIIRDIALKTLFETAQSLGFFPEGQDFENSLCCIRFDLYGDTVEKIRTYESLLQADCFGTEDLETIIKSFFETFPEKIYWIQANKIEVLHRTQKTKSLHENWRLYKTTKGITQHIEKGFIDTEWSEFQTSKKTALEMLLKQLEGQVLVINHQLENL